MVVFSKVTAVVAGLSVMASAVPTSNARQGFTVNQVAKPLTKPKTLNLAAVYAKALGKYSGIVPDHVKTAAVNGSAVTTPEQYDSEYLTPVNVGGTTLNLDFDTGSADLWVFSSELPASEQAGHGVYNVSSSKKLQGYSWSISYGDGSSASGDVYKDSVTVGGITASSQAVEAAQHISQQFTQDVNNDGLLGLAFSSINTVNPQRQLTFFDDVKSQLDSPLFAVTLKQNAPGTYDFGYIDNSKYSGQLTYTPVDNSQGFWGFTADGYAIGSGQANSERISAIADTGTTLLLLDTSVVQDYYSHVSGAQNSYIYGGYVFPCNAQLPSFTAVINGYKAVVPGSLLNYAPVTTGSSTCYGGIQDNSGIGFSIFGDIFLKSQYVVFDTQGPQLGFAPQA
uniref:Aspartic protease n=1 Tax=Evansstolkia leycettana TaxID=196907 RepID=A0A499RIG5_9EURO|nr:aspartic protease [Evansstolkia leycettana]